MVQNPPLGGGVWPGGRWPGGQATGRGPEGGPRAPGALLPGAAGEAAPWGRGWGGVAFDACAWGEGGADDGVAVVPARANGGNCSIRAATRRRHAVAMRLMVQNPPLGGGVWPGGRWPGGQATGRGQEGGPRAPGALLPGAAGEAAGWAVARRVVAGVRGGAWAGDPSLVAGEVAVGAGKWGELHH